MGDEIIKDYYDFISLDITSNCNLRCPFCSNNYKNIIDNINMTKETFAKIIKLLPLVQNKKFMFSCLFEPTLNPDFISLLEMIPEEGKEKVFFTTNLSIKQPQETFAALAKTKIAFLNISLDSLNPITYESLRKGAKFENFMTNLESLVATFKKYPNAPQIRFTTMVFKQNIGELLSMAYACHSKYFAYEQEFRTPFYGSYYHMDEEWAKKSVISRLEWDDLIENLSKLPYKFSFDIPPLPCFTEFDMKGASPLILRINSDGNIIIDNKDSYNIHDIENPYEFFKNKLYDIRKAQKQDMARVHVYKSKDKIKNFIKDNYDKKICFWGAGELAKMILEAYDFSKLNILGFIDGNPNKRGQKIVNYPVYSTDDLESLAPEIIVLSVLEHKYLAHHVNKELKKHKMQIKLIDDLFC